MQVDRFQNKKPMSTLRRYRVEKKVLETEPSIIEALTRISVEYRIAEKGVLIILFPVRTYLLAIINLHTFVSSFIDQYEWFYKKDYSIIT
jgi:hypothetical protein